MSPIISEKLRMACVFRFSGQSLAEDKAIEDVAGLTEQLLAIPN
jgi:hypothetical protein